MPKWYARHCDNCGEHYEGYGSKYCSLECTGGAAQRKKGTGSLARLPHLPKPLTLHIQTPKPRKPTRGQYTGVHYSDIHFPYHDPAALDILKQVIAYVDPDYTMDHGDTLDCEEISRFDKDPFDRVSVNEEIKMAARFCGEIHALTPHAEHYWMAGNHEDRLRKTFWRMAASRDQGEILTLPGVKEALSWGQLLGIKGLGWHVLEDPNGHFFLFDRLVCKHGSVVRKWAGYSARAEHEKYGKSGMSGHVHRTACYSQRTLNGLHAWWELGTLGLIRDDYVATPNWSQSFNVVSWSADRREYAVEQVMIHDGTAYFRGQRFEADPAVMDRAA